MRLLNFYRLKVRRAAPQFRCDRPHSAVRCTRRHDWVEKSYLPAVTSDLQLFIQFLSERRIYRKQTQNLSSRLAQTQKCLDEETYLRLPSKVQRWTKEHIQFDL